MNSNRFAWMALVAANVALWGVLGFQGRIGAAPPDARMPFDNAVQQRSQIIRELQEIKNLLRDQNALLRAAHGRAAANDRTTKEQP